MTLSETKRQALAELDAALDEASLAQIKPLCEQLAGAQRILLHGVGREGLMMRALAMRLFHMGLDAHVVGDMTAPPVGSGDLLFVSAGPGHFGTVAALVDIAKNAGARTLAITATPEGAIPNACEAAIVLNAQTMASDQGAAKSSVLPMGSLFELLMFVFFELLILELRPSLGVAAEAMRANHTNLE